MLRIAQVLKSNGTDGGLLISFLDVSPEDIDLQEPVFIYFDGLPVPFFIESFKGKGSGKALIRLTGIRNLKDAEEIAGLDIYAKKSSLKGSSDEDEGLSVEDLVGWSLLDKDGRFIGEITDFEPIPGNPCLYVESNGTSVMIPLHEDLILDIDEDAGTISVDIPEGLL